MKIDTTEKILSAISAVALFLFFGVTMPCHIMFQETFQMFQFTGRYFLETVPVPGGMSDYIAGFLVQFFINPLAGAAITAVTITAVQYLIFKASRCGKGWLLPLTFLPSLILTDFHCDELSMLSADISIIATLGLVLILMSIRDRTVLLVTSTVMVPAMFFAFGTISLLFIIPVIIIDRRFAFWGMPLAAICPAAAWFLTALPLTGLVGGLHFYRTFDFPVMPWIAGGSAFFIIAAGLTASGRRGRSHMVAIAATTIVTLIAGWFLISTSFKKHNCLQRELTYKYVFLLLDGKWETILSEYEKDGKPSSLLPTVSHNMALAQEGRLPDEMFRYPQHGVQGLIPKYKLDYVMPLVLSRIHFQLGFVNQAQRYAFESMQSIPFFQKSARCCRIIAETNRINGNLSVSRKYLEALTHTLFYRKQALRDISEMENDDIIKKIRERRLDDENLIYDESSIPEFLSRLYEKSEENTTALQYLLCYIMLQGDISSFTEHFDRYFPKTLGVPRHFAEALLVGWTSKHEDCSGLPWNISGEICSQCLEFRKGIMSGKSKNELRKQYGDTYWYYLLFNNRK